jgi:hypothetical protein
VKPEDTESKLTVKDYTPGDVNNDGTVSVTDVGCAINYILEQVPSVFNFDAADMNGDKSVSVTDVGMIINLILNEGATSRQMQQQGTEEAYLSLMPTDGGYELQLENKAAFIAIQFDVRLTDGTTINDIQLTDNNHILTYRKLNNGSYRVLCYSPTNSVFTGNESNLLKLSTTGDVTVSEAHLTTARFKELSSVVNVGTTNGIYSLNKGLQVSIQDGSLKITSDRETTLKLNSLDGRLYRNLKIDRGVNTFSGLRSGIYLIGNRKVILR